MINLPTIAAVEAAVQSLPVSTLRTLLADRLIDTVKCGLQDLTHILIVEADDSEAQIVEAIGFCPLQSRIDGIRNQPDWDWIERHEGWWELLYTVGNSGFAFIVLVQDDDHSSLALLCRRGGA